MKKLMAILAIISLVVPFANVKAEGDVITDCSVNSSCFVYKPGDEVNFYRNDDEKKVRGDGQTTIVIEDPGANSKYVKVLALSAYGTSIPYFDKKVEAAPTTDVKRDHLSYIDKASEYVWSSAKRDATGNLEMTYITLDELIKVFGAAKQADGTYTIDATKWGEKFALAAVGKYASKGFYTGTYDLETGKVWAVEYTLNETDDTTTVTAITVKEVAMDSNTYGYLPVVSFDKTYECHSRTEQNEVEMGCYSCDGDYKWLQVGTQAETCEYIPTSKSKGTCVKAVKTGVEDYILEFVGITLVCGIALVIAKKKDLFRSI